MAKEEKLRSASYKHSQKSVQRPDVGVEAQFPNKKIPKTYRYDSSLAPELCWDESGERPFAEWLLNLVAEAAEKGEPVVFAEPQSVGRNEGKLLVARAMRGPAQEPDQAFPELGGQGGAATDFSADLAAVRA